MIHKKDFGNIVSKTAALLFVFIYASSLLLSQFHLFVHESEAEEVICYEEENACHLKLVHQDVENGCDHESHFSDEQPTCDLCPLLQAKTETNEQEWQIELLAFNGEFDFVDLDSAEYKNFPFSFSTRGPPLNS